ncbi:unnamed protein product [Trifolium pratense]|uniref:Uncharacterized protein n=1 Tax=Trifolium pratense TaxID=57577 RepID=A0ACB0LZ77_TRIPR|nr:unnamed protein product [Trifolium pratense]
MEFPYLSIFILLNLVLVTHAHADFPCELYWNFKLPTTQMPKPITDLLHPAAGNGKVNDDIGAEVSETQLHDNETMGLFFLEKDLHHGTKMNMKFKKNSNYGKTFLPQEVAKSNIPFSSNKLVENILNMFSIKHGSKESEIVKNTISICEEKTCVTSLESMVDFATSKLGKNVEAISTEVNKESIELQEYVIAKGVKKLGEDNKVVVCHKVNYTYAVFYCHKIDGTKVYNVPLEGVDGNMVKVVAMCHNDTSQWNPKHISFQVLKVQPGTGPICHFVTQEHVVWVSK